MYPHRGGYGNVSKKVFSEKGLGTFCIPEHIFFCQYSFCQYSYNDAYALGIVAAEQPDGGHRQENERQVHLKQHP